MTAVSPVILVGLQPIGLQLLLRLVADGVPCHVLATHAEIAAHGRQLESLGVEVTAGTAPWAWELSRMPLHDVGALVLSGDDESVNVDSALAARHIVPDLPIAMRIDDAALRRFVETSVPGVDVFSPATAAAPAAVDLAMRVLSEAPRTYARRGIGGLVRGILPRPSALFWSVFLTFLVVLLPTAWYFARELQLDYFDAVYFVWVTVLSVGYGDINLRDASWVTKAVGMAVMLFGAGFTAAMVGLMADWLLTRRLGGLFVRVAVAMRDHVVVVGAGTVGTRVAERLHDSGVRVVVVERDNESPGVARLRAAGIPVVIGDASADDVMALASVDRAGIVLAMTERDATNLHIGLELSHPARGIPCVVRLQSSEIARHVDTRCAFVSISTTAVTVDAVFDRIAVLRALRVGRELRAAHAASDLHARLTLASRGSGGTIASTDDAARREEVP